jgi:hypothetical protein
MIDREQSLEPPAYEDDEEAEDRRRLEHDEDYARDCAIDRMLSKGTYELMEK